MSNSLGHSLLYQSLYGPNVLEQRVRANSVGVSESSVKPLFTTKFFGHTLNVKKVKGGKGGQRMFSIVPHAALTMDTASGLARKFNLDGNSELQIDVSGGDFQQIVIQVTNSSISLVLHWGGVSDRKKNWILPSRRPDGTQMYQNQALRTPFIKSGSSSMVKIEIDEPDVQALEFLVIDEARNKWFKDNGQNFRIQLLRKIKTSSSVSVPEDLVQVEYEAARSELLEEISRGVSIDRLRKNLTKTSDGNKTSETSVPKVQIKVENRRDRNAERIQRKKRDFMHIVNKYVADSVEENLPSIPKAPTAVELFSKAKEEQDGSQISNIKKFKLGDKELIALVTKPSGKTKVYLVTDFDGPLTLHWALSKTSGEWQAPPPGVLPQGSISLDKACETQFADSHSTDPLYQVQSIEIDIGENNYVGIPFVLVSSGNWIKNSGSDFYVEFTVGAKKVKKDAGDGKGTAKALLDKIAEMESEAQKSFMHRFIIAADLTEWAKDTGELGLAGILVWMRFMATRQLIWNKNYNVKPREISRAQDRLTDSLENVYKSHPQCREVLRMIMSTVGRGGEGDVGQRIRDEILVIQRNNDCKGGFMEEWHQKLHNNTSPDDVVICQALIDYFKSNLDLSVYWNTLNSNGITKERLLSYDRAIHNEPKFKREQKDGLLRDLGSYMRTLKAVHSGADLESAVANCMGYKAQGLLQFVLHHVEDKNVEALLEGLLEAREELRPLLLRPQERLKDLLFLDIALDSTVRTAIERGYEELNNAGPEKIMYFITLALENLALSSDNNEDLIYCLKASRWKVVKKLMQGERLASLESVNNLMTNKIDAMMVLMLTLTTKNPSSDEKQSEGDLENIGIATTGRGRGVPMG
ncbi:hypothetical protein GIB67_030617 [Kingdonia uniflora]|uniref:Uncharacterized protein n=1 Tax=Kingdonia uniflora TaxID=39325 RepID=A0A7J7LM68_9MAGN|nr:hypothetical protein GIB67_030617 [Kingdonia uniflora]